MSPRNVLIWHRYPSHLRQRRSTGGVVGYVPDPYRYPRHTASDEYDWSSLGEDNHRLYQSSKVLRAKKNMRRQFELYGPPTGIYKGLKNDRYKFPTFRPAYQWKFPGFGHGYGAPYRRYVPGPYFPQYY